MCPEEGQSYSLCWTIDRQPGLITIQLFGELDLASGEALEAAMAPLMREGSAVVADLDGVEFMDSTGIRLLGNVHRQAVADGLRFMLGRLSAPVRRVLHVAGLISFFDHVEGAPPDEVLCQACDNWVPAANTTCPHCDARL